MGQVVWGEMHKLGPKLVLRVILSLERLQSVLVRNGCSFGSISLKILVGFHLFESRCYMSQKPYSYTFYYLFLLFVSVSELGILVIMRLIKAGHFVNRSFLEKVTLNQTPDSSASFKIKN